MIINSPALMLVKRHTQHKYYSKMKKLFIKGLIEQDIKIIKKVPKSDLHNHADLGGNFKLFEKIIGKKINKPPNNFKTFDLFQNYILDVLYPILSTYKGANIAKKCSIIQAKEDGIKVLELSIDSGFESIYKNKKNNFINYINNLINDIYPELIFIPSLGLGRTNNIKELEKIAFKNIETGYFKSIDLYGNEMNDNPKKYKRIYKIAKKNEMKLKAHIGEYEEAEKIRETVELLELDEVQHGISAYKSVEIMKWLERNKIQLNICPTSNIKLHRIDDLKKHPIKILFDHGVKVTINSDDFLIFNSSVSEEYLKLYKTNMFSAEELNTIRENGLQNYLEIDNTVHST